MNRLSRLWLISLICICVLFGLMGNKHNVVKYKNMVDSSVLISTPGDRYGFGVFIDDNVILTAAHAIRYIDTCNIELNDGTILDANNFYVDDKEDIGFIFVDVNELHISKVSIISGNIGDTVYLVGSPYEKTLKFTITKGILSHLDRDVFHWEDLLQTDAEAAPGSSGGPLYNSKGEVIGVCVVGPNPGGGVTLCESAKSILEAYERCKLERGE